MTACEKHVTQGTWRATILVKGPPGSGGLTGASDQGTFCREDPHTPVSSIVGTHWTCLYCALRLEVLTIWDRLCLTMRGV